MKPEQPIRQFLLLEKLMNVRIADILFFIVLVVCLSFPNLQINKAYFILPFEAYILLTTFNKKAHMASYFLWGILFCGFAAGSYLWALYPQGVNEQLNNLVMAISLNIFIARYITLYNVHWRTLAKLMLLVLILLLVNTIINGKFNIKDNRLSIDINENTFGKIISYCGLFFFMLLFAENKRFKLVWMLPLLLFVFLSGSRKALVSCLFFMLFLYFSLNNKRIWLKLAIAGGVLSVMAAILLLIPFFYNSIGNRLVTMVAFLFQGQNADGSLVSRNNMVVLAWNLFASSPLYGLGMNNFKFATYYQTYSHNNYMELLSGLGILGLLLYYVPLVTLYSKMWKAKKEQQNGMLISISLFTMLFLLDIANVSYISMPDHIFLGLAAGLYFQTQLKKQKETAVKIPSEKVLALNKRVAM